VEGIDYSYGSGLTAAQIKNFGKAFVCRYLSGGNTKDISKAEMTNLVNAGIKVVLVWETTANRMLAGKNGGTTDAGRARGQADGLGAVAIPIYFACDFDAGEGQQATINAYLDGAAGVIGRGRVGLYAGYWPMKRAFDAGKISWGWATYAWSGGKVDQRAHLYQYKNNVKLGPATVDLNRSLKDDFGFWPRPGKATPPPQPQPPGQNVPTLTVDYFGERHNQKGDWVTKWQTVMRDKRKWKIKVDGVYGGESAGVCRQFQKNKKLKVDGLVGPQTWRASWTLPVGG
jgi:hypothetical protein